MTLRTVKILIVNIQYQVGVKVGCVLCAIRVPAKLARVIDFKWHRQLKRARERERDVKLSFAAARFVTNRYITSAKERQIIIA